MKLFELNEFGFLPVPPSCHEVKRSEIPSVFSNGAHRDDLSTGLNDFFDYVLTKTSIREVYIYSPAS